MLKSIRATMQEYPKPFWFYRAGMLDLLLGNATFRVKFILVSFIIKFTYILFNLLMPINSEITNALREWSELFMRHSVHDFKRFMDETNLSFSQVNILMRLFKGNDCGISRIGEHMGVSSAAASQAIEKLVQQGLVQRVEDPLDRRAKQLALTKTGSDLIERGIAARGEWMQALTSSFSVEQKHLVIDAINLLTQKAHESDDLVETNQGFSSNAVPPK